MSYGERLVFYLLHTRSVGVVHVMRVLVELVRLDCGSLFRHFLKHGGGINVKGG